MNQTSYGLSLLYFKAHLLLTKDTIFNTTLLAEVPDLLSKHKLNSVTPTSEVKVITRYQADLCISIPRQIACGLLQLANTSEPRWFVRAKLTPCAQRYQEIFLCHLCPTTTHLHATIDLL